MRILRLVLSVLVTGVVMLAPAAGAAAYDCTFSCPVGLKIADLDKVDSCLLVGAETDPFSWCNAQYSTDNVGTCPGDCGPIYWGVGRCERMSKVDTKAPYATIYYCEQRPLAEEVVCCTPAGPSACRGSCGTCQTGLTCSGGVCVNTGCPSDTDCVCDACLRLMA